MEFSILPKIAFDIYWPLYISIHCKVCYILAIYCQIGLTKGKSSYYVHKLKYSGQKLCSFQSPSILRTQLQNPQFFQNCDHFQYKISWNKVSLCITENYHNFETVFLKLMDFRSKITTKHKTEYIFHLSKQKFKGQNYLV